MKPKQAEDLVLSLGNSGTNGIMVKTPHCKQKQILLMEREKKVENVK